MGCDLFSTAREFVPLPLLKEPEEIREDSSCVSMARVTPD